MEKGYRALHLNKLESPSPKDALCQGMDEIFKNSWPISIFKKMVKCQCQKVIYQLKDINKRDIHVKYQSSSTHYSKLKFLKRRSSCKVNVTISKLLAPKRMPSIIGYLFSQSKIYYCSKVFSKVNVSKIIITTPGSQNKKNVNTHGKVLLLDISMLFV